MLARQTGPMVRDDQKPSQDNIGKACSHGRSLALGAGASELLVLAVHCTEHPLKLKMKFQQDNSGRNELADTVSTLDSTYVQVVMTVSVVTSKHIGQSFLDGSEGGLEYTSIYVY